LMLGSFFDLQGKSKGFGDLTVSLGLKFDLIIIFASINKLRFYTNEQLRSE